VSPYHDHFITFIPIVLKPKTAANKLAFDMTGCGDMKIEVPLGNGTLSKFLLKDACMCRKWGLPWSQLAALLPLVIRLCLMDHS
jgi:hypothetical protein